MTSGAVRKPRWPPWAPRSLTVLNVFVDVSKATFDDDDERYKCHVVCVQSVNTRTCLPTENNVACHRFYTIHITA